MHFEGAKPGIKFALGENPRQVNFGGGGRRGPQGNDAPAVRYPSSRMGVETLIRDRFTANVIWQKAFFGTYQTTVGLFYEGRKGKPYSWTYINDLNGDGISGNDLMYIPSAPGSGEVIFKSGAAEEARFWDVVNANPALASAKGGVVGRNNSYAPWVNNIDMRLSQQVPGFWKNHKATFTLDTWVHTAVMRRNATMQVNRSMYGTRFRSALRGFLPPLLPVSTETPMGDSS